MSVQTTYRDIPLTKLTVWEGNVRKTVIETGLDELAASIAAHGLLNPLTVTSSAKGKFAVIAGQRRLLALKRLAKAGTIGKAISVPCTLRDDEGDPTELSLAENVVRVAMHPADQFEAWRKLIDLGQTPSTVAVRFGVAESTVRKRMALARVSPRLFGLYRDDEMELEALQAFTVTDDHALQDSVWDGLSEWQRHDARSIRQALTMDEVATTDRRVRFVGIETYEAAGGIVRRDLFDNEGSGFCQDVALLDRLVRDKLDAVAEPVKAEGWAWTEVRVSFGWDERQTFEQADLERREPTSGEQAEADSLREEYVELDDEDVERAQAIEARLDALDEALEGWPETVMAAGGAVIALGYNGADITRGLIRAEEVAQIEAVDSGRPKTEQPGARPALSAALVEDLTAHKTAALRAELAHSPSVALALVVHALARSAFYQGGSGVLKAWVTKRSLRASIEDHDQTPAVLDLDRSRARIGDTLPGQHGDLWAWCLNASQTDLLDVLAVAAAHGLDAVVSKSDPNRSGAEHGEALAKALNLDIRQWWRPTADGYFSRISKAVILSDLADARQAPVAPAWDKMKKDDLAALAERESASTGWLPEPLR